MNRGRLDTSIPGKPWPVCVWDTTWSVVASVRVDVDTVEAGGVRFHPIRVRVHADGCTRRVTGTDPEQIADRVRERFGEKVAELFRVAWAARDIS